MQKVITDDMEALLNILPLFIRETLLQQPDISELLEVILDLGRSPEARFLHHDILLQDKEVEEADIDYVVGRISSFGEDNRAGIERTLHRISAIRNRKGRIVGLTCRVGRAVFGTIKIIDDLIQSGKSVLLLGRPGVGKTTMLREVARVLADDLDKRVIIVDTSNEIAGDGDIPHPAIGHARRMQVATPALQHAVMIEAVENHMPEVIVIDEIGTELEALASRTIAERGVQLVGTAHGNALENLVMNPTLSDLVGGIQSVTLGDEEARRRGTQKSVLERKSPPTFDIVVEIQDRDRVAIHPDVGEAVDALLRGEPAATEIRWLNETGEVEKSKPKKETGESPVVERVQKESNTPKVFLFGVSKSRLIQTARDMRLDVDIIDDLYDADVFVTSKNYYRRRLSRIKEAEKAGLQIYVMRSNTPPQMRHFLTTLRPLNEKEEDYQQAIDEAEDAAEQVETGEETFVDLTPQNSFVRRLQHLVAQRKQLASHSSGKDPDRRVRIFKEQS